MLAGVGVLAGTSVGIGLLAGLTSPAGATSTVSEAPVICSGTDSAPGQLAGIINSHVVVSGNCWVNAGVTAVIGDVTIAPGGTLNATFGQNDQAGYVGYTALYVTGNIFVERGGTLLLGCEPSHAPCSDDPVVDEGEPGPGTLTSHDVVGGSIIANDALGVIIHSSVIFGDISQYGGGGGESCATPASGFFASAGSPVFSDYEDNSIGGNLTVQDLETCWMGIIRNTIGGTVEDLSNVFGDPDANEVHTNQIGGGISCEDNSPQVQFGDSAGGTPNRVHLGGAVGECSFATVLPNPAPAGPLQPISVQA